VQNRRFVCCQTDDKSSAWVEFQPIAGCDWIGARLAKFPGDAVSSPHPAYSRQKPSRHAEFPMSETQRKGSLLVIFLTVFVDLLGFGMVLPLLPIYAEHLIENNTVGPLNAWMASHPGATLGLLMSSFSVMQFLFAPLWGRLSDRIGRRPVLM